MAAQSTFSSRDPRLDMKGFLVHVEGTMPVGPVSADQIARGIRAGKIPAEASVQWQGEVFWRGVYDDQGRLSVIINFNMDMGDAWENADEPVYPQPLTAIAYRFAINYLLYAMTH